nr:receptor-like protein 9a [Populus alba]
MDLRDNSFTGSIPNWIGNRSSLSFLLLRANHFDGELPVELCLLEELSILDVSQNQLSGPLPSCLGNLTFKESFQKVYVLKKNFVLRSIEDAYYETMGPPLVDSIDSLEKHSMPDFEFEEVIEFTTKNMYYGYKGTVLSYMYGIDLSNNSFVGAIPPEFGNLSEILSLNLSHNNLTGSIPATFSNLKHIESLDLSYNNLNVPSLHNLLKLPHLKFLVWRTITCQARHPRENFSLGPSMKAVTKEILSCVDLHCETIVVRNQCHHSQCLMMNKGDDGFIDMEVFLHQFSVYVTQLW